MIPSPPSFLRRVAALALALPLLAAAAAPEKPAPPPAPAVTTETEQFQLAARRLQERWQAAAPSAEDPFIRLLAGPPFAAGEMQKLAARSARDPLALGVLQATCGSKERLAGCPSQAPAVTLTTVDPDNAASWLQRLNAAVQAKDAADAQASLRRAAQANRYDPRLGERLKRLVAFAQQIEPGVPLPVVVAALGGALQPLPLAPLLDACRPPPRGTDKLPPALEAQRKQCWALLTTMAERGTDVAGAWTAASVMRRLALTDAEKKRAATLKQRADRLNAAVLVGAWATPAARIDLAPQGPWSLFLTDLMAVGEIAAIERALARSGKTLDDIRPDLPPPPLPPTPVKR
jgi:hypothetical protein